ncbi:hypothetical protein [Sporomusa sp. KB1]|jgi:ABC-type multidrug transport system permease subunit|uniref:hypothetical protein n=1 Tax=Sporomusa sp. KB1 TaxID=943346 RepID=UPI0011A3EAB8|nr:hypothetical protein [Sporomusa sp. KB1]TWH48622.1 hypothetical protein Salpa_4790 [Sporomusa sp. KB1]
MTLKLRISLYVALIASGLTLLVGAHNNITLTAMLYRTLVSLVLFAIIGYVCGQFAERYFQETLDELEPKGVDVTIAGSDDQQGDEVPIAEFEPLNPNNFENITLTQK